ncbi:hypothetical protein DEQ92_21095 [Haloferax sp. Atlit-6N]|uniref:hypothetical protein n=1 Tax=Haloferax sp. Atlit-6N TaxID=2077205 RepID=UPI000E23C3DC|nr:hypothetical protein [Haloferax sp. Atlit-6N]RDZ98623.1 hypothetical protein DEQ92_21095 [Haloferax sp. Atlit-6N]
MEGRGREPNTDGDLEAALGRIDARVYVMPFEKGNVFTVEDCQDEEEMIPNSEFYPISTPWGNFEKFGFDPTDFEFIDAKIGQILDEMC